ncbi:MAG: chorismate-binding protein [Clostridiales Family XIII bacterium]|jgi:anthranilate synthase component 1|nr:chorismate-binding protein [Clostridiales Family XIII bacterium]
MVRPTLDEARALSGGGSLIPIALELYADLKTPVEMLRAIMAEGRRAYILESAPGGDSWGRYSFLGYDPLMEISGRGRTVRLEQGGAVRTLEGDPQAILKGIMDDCASPRVEGMPPFAGGFVGYFAYEYVCNAEPSLRLSENDEIGVDDFRLMMFDKVIAFDSFRQKISLIANIRTDSIESSYAEGVARLREMERLALSGPPAREARRPAAAFSPSFSEEGFCAAVEKAKAHIREGDIFQCVPSIRFRSAYGGSLLQPYRKLRTTNPSAHMFYISFDGLEIAGASPETLVSLKDGAVSAWPLAGTCPRTDDEAESEALVRRMLGDEKELAEHDMLVDLGRNDLGKVCRFGSVRVEEYRSVRKLSHVCHIASKVSGELADGVHALDVMAAVLPAGTLSGAPKKRACEIIDGIEGMRRGPYGGAIGYLDFAGNMDLCIGIRMAVLKDGVAYIQAGAGIVADSSPKKEYLECLRKAEAMKEAFA